MASPHPSYPPLEMAHFGLATVTNRYLCKDWKDAHPNILPVDRLDAGDLAERLAAACRLAATPEATLQHVSPFTRDNRYPILSDLVDALAAELAGIPDRPSVTK